MDNFSPKPLGNDGCPDGRMIRSSERSFFAFSISFLDIYRPINTNALNSVHPETSSPLEGEGWGEGNKNGSLRNFKPLSPPP
jgi:hypothetical protein